MTSGILILAALMTIHFIADFMFQNDWMALNKSKTWTPLLTHTAVYALTFLLPLLFVSFNFAWHFVLLTFLLHTGTDYVTSRITSKLWFVQTTPAVKGWRQLAPGTSREETAFWVDYLPCRHNFFVVIGLDQLIHMWCLALAWLALYQ